MPRLTVRRVLVGMLVLLAILATVAWVTRKPIADAALRRALDARGVRASYTVKSIGLRWERIENVRIGDPRAPDLIAEWADIRVSTGLGGVAVTAVRAGGVRLHGRGVGGKLHWGDIDRLLPAPRPNAPFSLPDIDVDIADARVRIDTSAGRIDTRIDGQGNLTGGFSGKLAAIMPTARVSACDVRNLTADLDVKVSGRAPMLKGPVRADAARCAGVTATEPAANIDVKLSTALDQWRGTAAVEAQGVRNATAVLAGLSGRIAFDGTAANTRGTADLAGKAGRVGSTRLSGVGVDGSFATAGGLQGNGHVRVAQIVPDDAWVRKLDSAAQSARQTPVGPVVEQLAKAVRAAATSIAVTADAAFSGNSAVIARMTATGANGALLRLDGGNGLRLGNAGFLIDTNVKLSGGGFPTVRSTFRRRADGMSLGIAEIGALTGGGARLVLDRVRFAANPSGAKRIETAALLDGPLGDGRIEGLRVPVDATLLAGGDLVINTGCTPLSFRALSIAGLTLDPARLRLCPTEARSLIRLAQGKVRGGAAVDAPRLSGKLGSTPVQIVAGNARLSLGARGFSLDNIFARLGTGDRLSHLSIASLTGRFAAGAMKGRFTGTSGQIGNVPLNIDTGAGEWTFADGTLALRGGLRLSDASVPGRFNPLTTDNASLRLVASRIDATATLRTPEQGRDIVQVAIAHDLRAGTGSAALTVAPLRFDKGLQPERLTRLTLGIVANVVGEIEGRGGIRWSPKGVTSTGRFATDGLDFAAAFGPVVGLKGTVVFDDLLALATPPGQQVTIASINPGTLVTDGVITYQLLPQQRIAVEKGSWPFAGGRLLLDPSTLDMGQSSERKLTFRVVALDAAKFIQQLEFENLAATGIFDGILPMTFDASGGRIDNGRLAARQGGGTLAYVGEVSNAQMNIFAKLAFDALKSIRYRNLTIDLNGPLDGEIVSKISFDGVNESPLSPPKSFLARQFIGLPFLFNIRVTAPFRSLLNTARTLQDPTALLQRTLPEARKPPVQPPESAPRP